MNDDPHKAPALTILIVDDHPLILGSSVCLVKGQYPHANILTAATAEAALKTVENTTVDLVLVDLSIPDKTGESAQIDHGLTLLKQLMQAHPTLNLMVQSSSIKSLVRLRHDIDNHQGGFTIADKSLPTSDVLVRLNWSLQSVTHTKDLKTNIELKPEWLEVMQMAFEEGLQDKAIAKRMFKSERMVRHYWSKIQDILEIYPEEGQNSRTLMQIRAREEGFID